MPRQGRAPVDSWAGGGSCLHSLLITSANGANWGSGSVLGLAEKEQVSPGRKMSGELRDDVGVEGSSAGRGWEQRAEEGRSGQHPVLLSVAGVELPAWV